MCYPERSVPARLSLKKQDGTDHNWKFTLQTIKSNNNETKKDLISLVVTIKHIDGVSCFLPSEVWPLRRIRVLYVVLLCPVFELLLERCHNFGMLGSHVVVFGTVVLDVVQFVAKFRVGMNILPLAFAHRLIAGPLPEERRTAVYNIGLSCKNRHKALSCQRKNGVSVLLLLPVA